MSYISIGVILNCVTFSIWTHNQGASAMPPHNDVISYDSNTVQQLPYEFRIKLLTPESPVRSIKANMQKSCFHYGDKLGKDPEKNIPVRASLYRPAQIDKEFKGYLITAYLQETECYKSFFGYKSPRIIDSYPWNMDEVDDQFKNTVAAKYRNRLEQEIKDEYDEMETNEAQYDCTWLRTRKMSSKMLKIQKISLIWNIDNTLIQPLRNANCSRLEGSGICKLSEHSILIFNPETEQETCRVVPMAHIDGILFMENSLESSILNVYFISAHHDFTISIPFDSCGYRRPLCTRRNNQFIWDSDEGHIVEFSTSNSKNPIFKLFDISNIAIGSEETWIESIKNNKKVEDKVILKSNHLRFQRSVSNYTLIPEAIIEELDPSLSYICKSDNCTEDSLHISSKIRHKRSTIWNYPSYQRIQLLEEHVSWGFSEIHSFQNSLSQQLSIEVLKVKYEKCITNMNLQIGLSRMKDPYPYAQFVLKDPAIKILGRQGDQVYLKQGNPLAHILLPKLTNATWCNGSLLITYESKTVDKNQEFAWLRSYTGLAEDSSLAKGECITDHPPISFLIPTYTQGSYDYITNALIDDPKTSQSYLKFKFHFMELIPNDNHLNFERMEHQLSTVQGEEAYDSAIASLSKLYDSSESWTSQLIGTVLRDIVIPVISIMIFINILSFVLNKCSHTPLYSTKVRTF